MRKYVKIDDSNLVIAAYTCGSEQSIDKEVFSDETLTELIGMYYVNNTVVKNTGQFLTLDELKATKLKQVVEAYSAQYDEALALYSSNEQATFPSQEREAIAWSLDNTSVTTTIDKLATTRGVDRLYLIGKVLQNLDERNIATGQQQAMEDAIKACTTIEQLEAL